MAAYYNEIDKNAAAWLRELIKEGLIAPGDVDDRSIADVRADDLRGYAQCHFFAGIGGWSLALRLAAVPDERVIWTGSCPCQPFSVAGKGRGVDDERHLWPEFARLIRECKPPTVFGEQVASRAGRDWLASVFADLEGMGYAVAGADLCAAGVGAPHIRQRLYWVADAGREGSQEQRGRWIESPRLAAYGEPGRVADANGRRLVEHGEQHGHAAQPEQQASRGDDAGGCGTDGRLADAGRLGVRSEGYRTVAAAPGGMQGKDGERQRVRPDSGPGSATVDGGSSGAHHGGWSSADWLGCRDGKWRPARPGSFVLANGLPARVGRLRGYGNAIVPAVATAFVRSAL